LLDSGIGGLTVLAETRKALPDARLIYAADMAGIPYGTKTEAEVAARVAGLLGRMSERYKPRLACIACNTASTIALGMVREVLEIPIVGTVPAIKPAAALTKTGVIGLLGTQATIRQAYVDKLEAEFASDKRLIRVAAPGLVGVAEAKLRGGEVDRTVIERAVAELKSQPDGERIDTIVLACTHFPLLKDEIAACFGKGVQCIDGAVGIARRIAHLTDGQEFAGASASLAVTTGALDNFQSLAPVLVNCGIDHIDRF
jgi:glutamate racemase